MSYIQEKQTREDILQRVFNKSKSKASLRNTKSILNSFDTFCKHSYSKDGDTVIQDLKKESEGKVITVLQSWIDFMQIDHPDIMITRARNSKAKPLQKRHPSSVLLYFHKIKTTMLDMGVKFDERAMLRRVSLPIVEEELEPEPFLHPEIRLFCDAASYKRKILYMSLKDSAMRIGEAVAIRKRDVNLKKNPVEIYLSAKITKKRRARIVYITRETKPGLASLMNKIGPDDLIFGESENVLDAVNAEEGAMQRLREKLGKLEKYEHNGRYKKNIHSFRAFTATQASEFINEDFAHGLLGHKKYLGSYIRNQEKNATKYKKLEAYLMIYERYETVDNSEEVEQLRKEVKNLAGIVEILMHTKPKEEDIKYRYSSK